MASEKYYRGRAPWPGVPPARRKIMQSNKRRDTRPELLVRAALHRRGLRFRVDHRVVGPDVGRVHVDIAFTRWKVAAFVDGCFWHSCPIHGSLPKSNAEYWIPKLTANVTRDRATDKVLANAGWLVVRAWEHEDVTHIVDRVVDALDRAKRS